MEHWCHKCGSYTVWVEVQSRSAEPFTREKCRECGRPFPCRHECEHLDCAERRGDDSSETVVDYSHLDAEAEVQVKPGRSYRPEKTLFQRFREAGLDKPQKKV